MNKVPDEIKAEKEYWTRQMNDGIAMKNVSYEVKTQVIAQASSELTKLDEQLLKLWEKQR